MTFKYDLKNKVILTDCDGVLVDWTYNFHDWMKRIHNLEPVDDIQSYEMEIMYGLPRSTMKQYVRGFNASAAIAYLTPLGDAVKYVKKLHEECGFVFHCITSLSLDPAAQKARIYNLEQLFGPTVFEKVICLDTGEDKIEALQPYVDTECVWVEDKIENADLGVNFGLNTFLIAHDFNAGYKGGAIRVPNWKYIYEVITGGYYGAL
tara:strand:- start:1595 stop:2212 length:618 start_codon:yes stop_codon:yes gene_type:complete